MKIQMPDGKREECCAGHKILACEEMKSGIKMIGCSLFGVLYAGAGMIVDIGLCNVRRGPFKEFPFEVRMLLATAIILTCTYAAIGVLLQQPMTLRVLLRALCVVEAMRLLTYSLDMYCITEREPFNFNFFMFFLLVLLMEVSFAVLGYRKMVRAVFSESEGSAATLIPASAPAPAQPCSHTSTA